MHIVNKVKAEFFLFFGKLLHLKYIVSLEINDVLNLQPTGRLKCMWSSFYDPESPLQEYIFSLGTAEGLSNVISEVSLPANTTWFQTDGKVFKCIGTDLYSILII